MARKNRKYKRLPGRPFALFGARSLWQGDDHLLWVESVFFMENYKRFFYRDIQSIVVQRGGVHTLWSAIWGVPAFICCLVAFLVQGTPYVSGIFASVFLLALGINLVLGPSCSVYLQTGVQIQKIESLKRIRTARKAIARIKELVEAAQGPLVKTRQLSANAAGVRRAPSSEPLHALSAAGQQAGQKAPAEAFNPLLHNILFGCLLALGVLESAQLVLKSLSIAVLAALLHGGILVLVIVSLTRWHRHIKETLTARINWLALVFIVLESAVGYALYIAAAFSNPQINYHHWELFKSMFQLQMTDHPLALTGHLIYAIGSLLLGISGMLAVRRLPSDSDSG